MKIYQPMMGVGAASKDNSYRVIDDAGIEIGLGGLTYRLLKKVYEERPLLIDMVMNAHPIARDMLLGALLARAESIKEEMKDVPARITTSCALDDHERHDFFLQMGFDDYNGLELFALKVPDLTDNRHNYPPIGTSIVDVDLKTRKRREEFLLRMESLGADQHADEWLTGKMRGVVFIAKAVYYGSDFAGGIIVVGDEREANLDFVGVETRWRGKGVASSLIDEALLQLGRQGVPYLVARAERRNNRAMKVFRKCGFDWIRTEELLLGKDI